MTQDRMERLEQAPAAPPTPAGRSASPASTAPAAPAATVEAQREQRWRAVRRGLAAAYAAVLVGFIAVYGIPLDRIGLTLWVLGALAISVVGRGWRAFGRILLDWLPFTGILVAYDYTRGLAGHYGGALVQGADNALGFPLHVTEPAAFDRWLFGGTVPTVWLQHHLFTFGWVHWYDLVVTLVYLSHFLATPVVAMVLWIRARDRFRAWVGCVVAMAVLGVATYIVYPMAPPWMASNQGVIAPISRISGLGWSYLDLGVARQVLSNSQALANPVAAMPSLHTGYATMVALFFMVGAPWWRRVLLACYPLLMGWALVYSGEHYVLDVLAGMLYAAVIVGVWLLLRRRRSSRSLRSLWSPRPHRAPRARRAHRARPGPLCSVEAARRGTESGPKRAKRPEASTRAGQPG